MAPNTDVGPGQTDPRRAMRPTAGLWDDMTVPTDQDAPAADVAMPAADAPTVEAAVDPSTVVPPTAPIAAPVTADVTLHPTTPVRSQVLPSSAEPSAVATEASPGGTLTEPLLSPAGQAQSLRELAQQQDERLAESGDQAEEAAPTATKSGEEQEPEPDLEDDVQRIFDGGLLPSPQVRAQSPHDDSMTGGVRAEGSQNSETDTESVVTMSGGEALSALQVDLAAVIDDDIVSDFERDVDPNDEASSFGGRTVQTSLEHWSVRHRTKFRFSDAYA
jgi:hypothetical protein